jgi:hypothetical protein
MHEIKITAIGWNDIPVSISFIGETGIKQGKSLFMARKP